MPSFAANLTMLFTELPMLDRFAAAAKAGFTHVEFLFPYEFKAAELAHRLKDNGLSLVLHNLPAGDWAKGERGIACHPDRVDEFRASVPLAIEYAHSLSCPQVNCLAGITPAGADPALVRKTLVENLRFAANALEKAGIRMVVEAINTRDIPGFYLHGTRQTLGILDEVGSANALYQYDIYHMQIMEGDIARTIETNLARIGHIQLADNPGRNEPGTGELNYPFLFDHLDRIGYRGFIGCEYKPKTTTEDGLDWFKAAQKG